MITDERLALLFMYADTLATANKIGAAVGTVNWIPMLVDPAEVADAIKEIQEHRATKEEAKPLAN
jgi:hypothetical protein